MKTNKYSIEGKVIGEVELPDAVFNAEINDVLIYEIIKAANANLRQGTRSTKRRAEVSGGGIKPWKQKGTGRARQGSIRSPQWRGGGIIFGPHPQNFRIDLPKRIKKEAMISILSLKMKEGSVKVVENIKIKEGKTKEIAVIGKSLQVKKAVLITESEDSLLKRAIRNIPWFTYNNVKRISSLDLFNSKIVLLTEDAIKHIEDKYGK